MKWIDDFKKQIKQDKIEKERIKQREKEDQELEKEILEKYPNLDTKFSFDSIKTLFEDEEELDEEFNQYLTDSQKKEMADFKKEEKKYTIIPIVIFSVVIFSITITYAVLTSKGIGTELGKIEPIMKEYLETNYPDETIDTIELLDIEDYNKKDKDKIHIGKTISDKYIVAINEKIVGDTIKSNSDIIDNYNKLIKSIGGSYDLISTSPKISYKDCYQFYNLSTKYLEALPKDLSFNDMYSSGKLTVSDIIIYQGQINYSDARNIINKLSSDSRLIFIKMEKGLPKTIAFISKTEYIALNVLNTLEPIEGINYYELPSDKNAVKKFKIQKIKDNGIELLDKTYKSIHNYKITYDSNNYGETKKLEYFFISIDSNKFSRDNIVFANNSKYDGTYKELKVNELPLLYTTTTGGKIYIVGNEKITFGNITENNDSILCNLGLC